MSACAKERLFDHLVGDRKESIRDFKPNRFAGLEVHDQFEPSRHFNGQIRRARAVDNLIDQPGRLPVHMVFAGARHDGMQALSSVHFQSDTGYGACDERSSHPQTSRHL